MNRKPYITGEYYHVYNRGVDKRKIFLNKSDYKRFLSIMSVFNDAGQSKQNNITRHLETDKGSTFISGTNGLVEVDEYCLMPNHFHLLLRQIEDNGISKFLQRVITGYTMYFNIKNNRTGVLFQGRHKSKHINNEPYFFWLRQYIHMNPLDLSIKNWKENGVSKLERRKAINFLNNYEWVSCKDYSKYSDSLTDLEFQKYQEPK